MANVNFSRLVLDVEFISAAPIEGTDKLMVTLRTQATTVLELRLTRPEAADLVELMVADRGEARAALEASDGRSASTMERF